MLWTSGNEVEIIFSFDEFLIASFRLMKWGEAIRSMPCTTDICMSYLRGAEMKTDTAYNWKFR
jgi:hypothetical protein